MSNTTNFHIETLAVHAGVEPDPMTGAVMTPIYQTSTYAQDDVAVHKGYEYSRTDNPTRTALQTSLAALENGRFALCFSSGMAAIDTLLRLVKPNEHVVCGNDVYGGTYRLFDKILSQYGITFSFAETTDLDAVAAAVQPNTRFVWVETPTNPMLKLTDIAALAQVAHDNGAQLAVDNTFASPILQRPLTLGADLVLHSATKFLGGHADALGGVICGNKELVQQVYHYREINGATLHPMAAYLLLRGMKTLHLRVRQQNASAMQIARFLESHPAIERVFYPGLASHSGHTIAQKQMSGFGGMMSFMLKENSLDAVRRFLPRLRLAHAAANLGAVETIVGPPATTSHVECTAEERAAMGIPESLIRYSTGIEDVEDLLADLAQALAIF